MIYDNNNTVKIGDTVQLLHTNDKYTDCYNEEYIGKVYDIIPIGESIGELFEEKGAFTQIWVNWRNGSNFAIVTQTGDKFRIL